MDFEPSCVDVGQMRLAQPWRSSSDIVQSQSRFWSAINGWQDRLVEAI